MAPNPNPVLRWVARGTSIAIAGLLLAFVLGEPRGSLREIHSREWVGMLFLFGSVAAMLLAWRWEFPAALVSIFALAAFAAVVRVNRCDVLAIMAIPSLLFLLNWKLRRLHSAQHTKAG